MLARRLICGVSRRAMTEPSPAAFPPANAANSQVSSFRQVPFGPGSYGNGTPFDEGMEDGDPIFLRPSGSVVHPATSRITAMLDAGKGARAYRVTAAGVDFTDWIAYPFTPEMLSDFGSVRSFGATAVTILGATTLNVIDLLSGSQLADVPFPVEAGINTGDAFLSANTGPSVTAFDGSYTTAPFTWSGVALQTLTIGDAVSAPGPVAKIIRSISDIVERQFPGVLPDAESDTIVRTGSVSVQRLHLSPFGERGHAYYRCDHTVRHVRRGAEIGPVTLNLGTSSTPQDFVQYQSLTWVETTRRGILKLSRDSIEFIPISTYSRTFNESFPVRGVGTERYLRRPSAASTNAVAWVTTLPAIVYHDANPVPSGITMRSLKSGFVCRAINGGTANTLLPGLAVFDTAWAPIRTGAGAEGGAPDAINCWAPGDVIGVTYPTGNQYRSFDLGATWEAAPGFVDYPFSWVPLMLY